MHIVEKYIELWNAHDSSGLTELFTADGIFEDKALGIRCQGHKELAAFFQGGFQLIPDSKIEVEALYSSNNACTMESRFCGSPKGSLGAITFSGAYKELATATIFVFEGNKLKRVVDYWDLHKAVT